MNLPTWLALFGICLAGAMSPGPSLAVVLRETARGGRQAGISCALAHGAGVGLYALATVTGLSLLLVGWPVLATMLQAGGAVYLLWLGWRAWVSCGGAAQAPVAEPVSLWRAATNGLMIAVLNPKLALFMLALFSQFLPREPSPAIAALLILTAAVTDAVWYSLVAVAAAHPAVGRLLTRGGVITERLFALLLAGLGGAVLLRLLLSAG